MILVVHIVIAIASIIVTGYSYARPAAMQLYLGIGLVTATLASGTYLVMTQPAHLASACVSGLMYLAVVATAIAATYRKLARKPTL